MTFLWLQCLGLACFRYTHTLTTLTPIHYTCIMQLCQLNVLAFKKIDIANSKILLFISYLYNKTLRSYIYISVIMSAIAGWTKLDAIFLGNPGVSQGLTQANKINFFSRQNFLFFFHYTENAGHFRQFFYNLECF